MSRNITRVLRTKAFITDIVRSSNTLVRKQRLSKHAMRSVTRHQAFFDTVAIDPLWHDFATSCTEAIAKFKALADATNAGDPLNTVGTLSRQMSTLMDECNAKWSVLLQALKDEVMRSGI